MHISIEKTDEGFLMKLKRSDGKFASLKFSEEALRDLNRKIINVLPSAAISDDMLYLIERFNENVSKISEGKYYRPGKKK